MTATLNPEGACDELVALALGPHGSSARTDLELQASLLSISMADDRGALLDDAIDAFPLVDAKLNLVCPDS